MEARDARRALFSLGASIISLGVALALDLLNEDRLAFLLTALGVALALSQVPSAPWLPKVPKFVLLAYAFGAFVFFGSMATSFEMAVLRAREPPTWIIDILGPTILLLPFVMMVERFIEKEAAWHRVEYERFRTRTVTYAVFAGVLVGLAETMTLALLLLALGLTWRAASLRGGATRPQGGIIAWAAGFDHLYSELWQRISNSRTRLPGAIFIVSLVAAMNLPGAQSPPSSQIFGLLLIGTVALLVASLLTATPTMTWLLPMDGMLLLTIALPIALGDPTIVPFASAGGRPLAGSYLVFFLTSLLLLLAILWGGIGTGQRTRIGVRSAWYFLLVSSNAILLLVGWSLASPRVRLLALLALAAGLLVPLFWDVSLKTQEDAADSGPAPVQTAFADFLKDSEEETNLSRFE